MGLLSFIGGLLGLGGTPSTRAIQVSKASAASGLPIIYGRRKVTPIKVFKTVSRNNAPLDVLGETYDHSFITQSPSEYEETRKSFDWLHRIDVWGQGKITAIEKFWLDGDEATISRFKNRPYFRALSNYGSDSQTAMTALTAASGRWTVSHRGLGVAYTWSRFYNSSKKPQFNAEPNLKAQVKGLGVYDPRKDSSQPGGAGNQTFADPSSWSYSENRALLVLNYLTSDYGFAAPLADVDVPSFMKAADQCDEPATIPARSTNTTGGIIPNYWDRRNGEFIDILPDEPFLNHRENQVGTSQPRWHASAELDPKLGVIKNLKLLLEGFGWALTWSNGKHRLVLEDAVAAPVATFGEDSIMGGWTSDHGMRDGRWNRITVEFPNENKDFEQDTVSWPEKGSTQHNTYLAEDGGEELHKVEQVSTITDYYRAQAYAEYLVRKSRVGHRIKGMRLAPEAMLLEPGDVIAIDYAAKGFVDDWFFVERVSVSRTLEVSVDLLKYDATVYDPDARTDEPVDLGKDSPDLWLDPPAVQDLNAVPVEETKADGSVISGLDVTWDAPDATVGIDRIELAWRVHEGPIVDGLTQQDHTADGDYVSQAYVARDVTSYRIMGLADDKNYDIRVVYWTQRGQRSDEAVKSINLIAANSKLDGIDDGATRNVFLGAYDDNYTYVTGDVVTYEGSSYVFAATAAVGVDPTDATYWALLAAAGTPVQVEYSAVNPPSSPQVDAEWHSVFNPGADLYMRQNTGGGTWTDAMRIVGENGADGANGANGTNGSDGSDGNWVDYRFRRSVSQPGTPSGTNPSGWYDGPPSGSNPLWMVKATKTYSGSLVGFWSTPIQLNGNDGEGGISVVLTNDSHTVTTAADGTGGSYSSAGGEMKLYVGTTEVTSGVSYSIPLKTSGLSISINSSSGVYTVTACSPDQATATLRATYGGQSYDKIYTIAKAKTGGGSTARSASTPLQTPYSFSSASYQQQGGTITLDVGPDGTISGVFAIGFETTGNTVLYGEMQYRPVGGSWATLISAQSAAAPGEPGFLIGSTQVAFSGSQASYEFRFRMKRSGTNPTIIGTPTIKASWTNA